MKALSINPKTRTIKNIDIQMQANTIYTFFKSILIDELDIIKEHTVYLDADALSKNKTPFFIAEQLVIGDTLILSSNSIQEQDISISKNELETLISYDITKFYKDSLKILSKTNINLYNQFNVTKNNEVISLNIEWVLSTFNIADDKTKEYFIKELTKSINSKDEIENFMKKMAQLAIDAT
jgi:hypothetical protein